MKTITLGHSTRRIAGTMFFLYFPPAFAQAPAAPPPTDPKVSVPVGLLQALVNAGQDAPGKVINPLTDQVRNIVNEQLGAKAPAQLPAVPPQTPNGAPQNHPLPEPEKK